MITRLSQILVAALSCLPAAALAAPAESPATSPDDTLLTVAQVREGKSTRTVELEPFRPVDYLEGTLGSLPPVNAAVVRKMLAYPREGQHSYFWPKKGDGVSYDGCTTDVLIGGAPVMKGEAKGRTFCCGLTLEVFYRILQEQPRLPEGLTAANADEVKKLWFCRAINAPGPEDAMEALGVGRKISSFEEALPGDFVQIWRGDKSGHSVLFVAWAHDRQGKRVGLHYWSTQIATRGIGFHTELFGQVDKGVLPEFLSISRLEAPGQWRAKAGKL